MNKLSMLQNALRSGSGRRVGRGSLLASIALGLMMMVGFGIASGQTAGDGAITGTVKDKTGASIPSATVSAKNDATGVVTSRTTDGAGIFQISPLIIGTYTVEVSAKGFEKAIQQNISINENQVFGFNPVLSVGSEQQAITVTEAPPALDTANAQLGQTISAQEFSDLPVMVTGNQQRDVTSFSNYLPGAQPGARSSLFSGTASRVEEVYLDGLPLTTISQIGDNRPIFNLVPFEGIGQVGALTSGQSVEYQGAGSVNYTLKSGGNKFHGVVADYIRNRALDTWGFSAGYATQPALVNGVVTNVPVGKPADHQNEFALSIGGPISIPKLFNGHDKLFFEFAYDKVHSRSAPAYALASIPTTLMQQGDFTELLASTIINGKAGPGITIYDPTTNVCTGTPVNCTRSAFMGMKNGLATANVIPQGEISPIAQKMQSYLPQPTTPGLQSNYLGGIPSGYDNWLYSGRIDYTVSPKQTISASVTGGNRHAVPYTSGTAVLPVPYLASTFSTVAGHWADFSDSYTIKSNLVNQFKFGFSNFGGPPLGNLTQGTQYAATNMGIQFTGVPSTGQAVTEFPTSTFSGTDAQSQWTDAGSGPTATTVTETYTLVDNFLWIKGKHAFTFGGQYQFLEDNADASDGPTGILSFPWSPNETSQEVLTKGAEGFQASTGYSYASYMLGAVDSSGITLQPFSVLGGRYRPFAPYVADDYKITSRLTLNLGLRWDWIPSYQEALSRFSYLNSTLTNPVTGNPGTLEFAGNWGGSGVSCGCASPATTYKKNFGPRLGLAYAATDKIVIRAAFSTVYSHGGGTGGAGNAYNGPSQLGFTSSPSYTAGAAGPGAGPAFYLNTSAAFTAMGIANANFGGPGVTVPPITPPGAISQTLNVGNTVTSSGAFVTASSAPGYADPYLSGRAPEFNFWNVGIEQQMTNSLTLILNYAGSQSHFLAGASNMRGLQAGQINPIYWALGSQLSLPATAANLAAANVTAAAAGIPTINLPYPGFGLAAASGTTGGSKATIQQALTWMPQFSSTADTWGSQSANASYNSAQISIIERLSHGLQFTVNYTFSKNIDDAGTQRSGWTIPANHIATGRSYAPNRIDRSISANSVPEDLNIYGTYELPFGRGHIGNDNWLVRNIAGGWKLSELFNFSSGTPLLFTDSACTSTFQPTAGTCMPDINPNYSASSIRVNGKYGQGLTATGLGSVSYLSGGVTNSTLGAGAGGGACATTTGAFCNPGQYMIGDAPRAGEFGVRNPDTYNLNMSILRSFNLMPHSDRMKFVFRVDCQNVTNHVTFTGLSGAVNSSAFGTFTGATSNGGSRDFQLSGRLTF